MLRSQIRRTPDLDNGALRDVPATRSTTIATSSANNDGGVFNLNFRDEQYMPFEGAGAVNSEWKLSLPAAFRPFDYGTISDVILHISYTADYDERYRDKIEDASSTLEQSLKTVLQRNPLQRLFSLRHEFPTEWHRFLNPPAGSNEDQTLTMALTKERFPFLFQGRISAIDSMELFVKVKPAFADSHNDSTLKLSLAAGSGASSTALPLAAVDGLLNAEKSPAGPLGAWTLTAWLDGAPHMRLNRDGIQDILLLCRYACS